MAELNSDKWFTEKRKWRMLAQYLDDCLKWQHTPAEMLRGMPKWMREMCGVR
jgi:hypothetical protein